MSLSTEFEPLLAEPTTGYLRPNYEPWPECVPCVAMLVEVEPWHVYEVLSDSCDYSSRD